MESIILNSFAALLGPDFPEKKKKHMLVFFSTEQVTAATGTRAKKIVP